MITPRQRQTMLYLQDYMAASGGVPPSFDEICEHLGVVSRSAAHRLVHGLAERGYLKLNPHYPRSLVVLRPVTPIYAAYKFDAATKKLRRMR